MITEWEETEVRIKRILSSKLNDRERAYYEDLQSDNNFHSALVNQFGELEAVKQRYNMNKTGYNSRSMQMYKLFKEKRELFHKS